MEQFENLVLAEAGIRVTMLRQWIMDSDGLAADGGGAGRAGLGSLQPVVIGAQKERAGWRLDARSYGNFLPPKRT